MKAIFKNRHSSGYEGYAVVYWCEQTGRVKVVEEDKDGKFLGAFVPLTTPTNPDVVVLPPRKHHEFMGEPIDVNGKTYKVGAVKVFDEPDEPPLVTLDLEEYK